MLMSFANAANLFNNSCSSCKQDRKHNCAHYASDAMARAGFNILEPHSTIKARCNGPEGTRRVLRAVNLRDWVVAKGYSAHASRPPIGTAAFFYCKLNENGREHVGFISTTGQCIDTGSTDDYGESANRSYYYWTNLLSFFNVLSRVLKNFLYCQMTFFY